MRIHVIPLGNFQLVLMYYQDTAKRPPSTINTPSQSPLHTRATYDIPNGTIRNKRLVGLGNGDTSAQIQAIKK